MQLSTFFFFTLISFSQATQNITVDDTDPSIVYSSDSVGQWIHQSIVQGQASYLNICSNSTLSSTKDSSTATFVFNGAAVYLQSLKIISAGSITATLDGTIYGPFQLSSPQTSVGVIFSKAGLDTNTQHTLTVRKYNPSSDLYVNIDAIIVTSEATGNSLLSNFLSSTTAHGHSAALIGGVVAGILVLLMGICAVTWYFRRRARPNARPVYEGEEKWVVDDSPSFSKNSCSQDGSVAHLPVNTTRYGLSSHSVSPYAAPTIPSSSSSHSHSYSEVMAVAAPYTYAHTASTHSRTEASEKATPFYSASSSMKLENAPPTFPVVPSAREIPSASNASGSGASRSQLTPSSHLGRKREAPATRTMVVTNQDPPGYGPVN